MFVWLIVGLALAFLLLMLLNWWAKAEVKTAKSSLFWAILAVCAILTFALMASGKGLAAILPIGFAAWRMFGAKSMPRGRAGPGRRNDSGPMSPSEAREVLGVREGAGEQEINAAYRQLMAKYHPDKGGNDWMASKLNEARKALLGK
ncbi:J domain-containing protein [Kordiimonas aestuarii]|uniref:J domain-containing protein n=1 Tax=Kordiimonas aestuarii TaxID=1005925 RepID=UPI0021CF18E5|nr:DnaJ domain-containing protein [Kordiimonas aestuarii]